MTKKETLEIKRYKPEQIRDGIFSLRTRRLGTVAESLIKILANASWGEDISHDLFEPKEMKRIEVKFSCALRAHKNKIKENNILEEIAKASGINRMFSSKDWKDNKFDCNIQQVKRKKFDTLYYGIFFSDKVQIFKIKSTIISSEINYSDKQHAGNKGEGQFHLNNNTYEYHLENFLEHELSYAEILDLLIELQKVGKLNVKILTIIFSIIQVRN